MTRVLVTGSEGLIGGYLTDELVSRGYDVVGLDDFSKHGLTGQRENRQYELIEGDASDPAVLDDALIGCDHFIACAAMIGGLGYLHGVPLDLMVTNERLTINAALGAIRARKAGGPLQKVTWISSSMVYESADHWPSAEGDETVIPTPPSTYGFQKLSVEYFAKAARGQYGLPYTIIRPFNVIGVRDYPPDRKGEVGRFTSHVVPDLCRKVLEGQDPLKILGSGGQVRCYTWAGDLAYGIAESLEHPAAMNEDFNIARDVPITVAQLAAMIWRRINGPKKPFRFEADTAFTHDVQRRIPAVSKAMNLIGFMALTPLEEMLDQVIPWCRQAHEEGRL